MKKLFSIVALLALAGCVGSSSGPVVLVVDPPSGSTTGGTAIVITGESFNDGSTVTIGGSPATDVVWVDANTLNAVTPAGVTGAADVTVVWPAGNSGTLAGGFTYTTPTLTINIVDESDVPIAGAFVMLGLDPATEFQGTTDANGQIAFTADGVDMAQTITAGKAGYRNLTVVGSTAPEVFISLTLLEKPHGYISASVDPATWAPIPPDNCPAPPAPPCILRVAWASVPSKGLGESIDVTDCPACLSHSPFIVPLSGQPLELPAFFDQTKIFAVAGLLDLINFTLVASKFGTASFAVDSTNDAAHPLDVAIPLTMDVNDTTAVTISLVGLLPDAGESLAMFLAIDSPLFGLPPLGGVVGNIALGATKISDYSYSIRGLIPAQVAANPDLAGSSYGIQAGFQGTDTMRLSLTESPFIDSTQSIQITSLLGIPTWLAPQSDDLLDQPIGYDFSWQPVDGLTMSVIDFNMPYFNGTEVDTKTIWEALLPAGTTDLQLPVLPDATLPGFEACSAYSIDSSAISLTGFSYSSGNFVNLDRLMLENMPTLLSNNAITIFTSGTGCGPIITNEDTMGGGAGSPVTITGKYFGDIQGASTMTFGANVAAVTSWSDTSIGVTVPAGCAGAGVVKVNATVGGQISNDAYFECQ